MIGLRPLSCVRRYSEALLPFDIAVNFSSGEGAGGGPLAFVSDMAGHSDRPDEQHEASGGDEGHPRYGGAYHAGTSE